jgi:hypothetical protein
MPERRRPKQKQASPAHPEDAGMIREGSPLGEPLVRLDPAKGQNYHLNRLGARVYHEVPAGFQLDDQGAPQPIPAEAAPEDKSDG